jgi:tetratricopeptide (TPR) repeat protein
MRKLYSLFLILLLSLPSWAQTAAEYYQQAKDKIAKLDETGAYPLLLKAIKLDNKNADLLTCTAFYASREGNRQKNKELRNAYFEQAKIFIDAAIKITPNDVETNYVLAVVLGRIALVSSSKEKVAVSRHIKEVVDKAIQLNPNHAGSWHALGRWNYEISQLNFVEKAAVNMLFGGLPTGDLKSALTAYAKSIQLNPLAALYYLDYAIALNKNNQTDLAKTILQKLLTIPNSTQDDASIKLQAQALLKDWI